MSSPAAYPKKLFYKIQEVANIIGVEAYVLRYWETKFPMLNPEKDGSDQRRYRQKDIDLLLRIRELLHVQKYTIAGAVEKLRDEVAPGGASSRAKSGGSTTESTPTPLPASQRDLFEPELPPKADTATPVFEERETPGLTDEQRDMLRRVKDELGLLRRELETWRDELA